MPDKLMVSNVNYAAPIPAYVPLSRIAFGNPFDYVVLPHELPPRSANFPSTIVPIQAWPSLHVVFDEKRNGVAF